MAKRRDNKSQDKMFLCVKNGMGMRMTPQNAAGWRALLI